MPCSINFSLTLQTEILSTITSDFVKQMIILKSFNSVFCVNQVRQLLYFFYTALNFRLFDKGTHVFLSLGKKSYSMENTFKWKISPLKGRLK